jgi:outer membrane murein-binding lipoprotein Lpp
MINKIKISLLVILAVLLGSVYAAGCLPEGLDLFETG